MTFAQVTQFRSIKKNTLTSVLSSSHLTVTTSFSLPAPESTNNPNMVLLATQQAKSVMCRRFSALIFSECKSVEHLLARTGDIMLYYKLFTALDLGN